ncbi:MAG: hypothetical protein WC490_02910 [Candidatus Margulisiibacteriota bacterium]
MGQKLWQETMRILGGQLSPMQTDRGFANAVDIVSLGRDYYVKRLETDNIEAEGLAYDILEKLTSLGFSRYECIIILNGIASQCALFQKENLETVLSQLEVNKRLENAYFSKD